ncbi:hypothetical protein GCM10028784_21900 [Myceligenerans cantabricum]
MSLSRSNILSNASSLDASAYPATAARTCDLVIATSVFTKAMTRFNIRIAGFSWGVVTALTRVAVEAGIGTTVASDP